MSRLLRIAGVVALLAGSPVLARAQQCPDTCPVGFSVVASGGFQPGDIVTLTPINVVPATSALLGVVGGGFVCHTCTPCKADIVVSWTIVTNSCVSYNTCGLLQNGPGSGSRSATLTRNCNDSALNLTLEYGGCNVTGTCPPPVVSPLSYKATWTLTCGNCQ